MQPTGDLNKNLGSVWLEKSKRERVEKNWGRGGSQLSPKLACEEQDRESAGTVVKGKEGFILGDKELLDLNF